MKRRIWDLIASCNKRQRVDAGFVARPTSDRHESDFAQLVIDAVRAGQVTVLSQLLATCSHLFMLDKATNRSPLHFATGAHNHHYACATIMLQHGADVNATDSNNANPLHLCTSVAIAELLINHGASLSNTLLSSGDTPLHCACRLRNTDMVVHLIRCGASQVTRNKDFVLPLTLFVSSPVVAPTSLSNNDSDAGNLLLQLRHLVLELELCLNWNAVASWWGRGAYRAEWVGRVEQAGAIAMIHVPIRELESAIAWNSVLPVWRSERTAWISNLSRAAGAREFAVLLIHLFEHIHHSAFDTNFERQRWMSRISEIATRKSSNSSSMQVDSTASLCWQLVGAFKEVMDLAVDEGRSLANSLARSALVVDSRLMREADCIIDAIRNLFELDRVQLRPVLLNAFNVATAPSLGLHASCDVGDFRSPCLLIALVAQLDVLADFRDLVSKHRSEIAEGLLKQANAVATSIINLACAVLLSTLRNDLKQNVVHFIIVSLAKSLRLKEISGDRGRSTWHTDDCISILHRLATSRPRDTAFLQILVNNPGWVDLLVSLIPRHSDLVGSLCFQICLSDAAGLVLIVNAVCSLISAWGTKAAAPSMCTVNAALSDLLAKISPYIDLRDSGGAARIGNALYLPTLQLTLPLLIGNDKLEPIAFKLVYCYALSIGMAPSQRRSRVTDWLFVGRPLLRELTGATPEPVSRSGEAASLRVPPRMQRIRLRLPHLIQAMEREAEGRVPSLSSESHDGPELPVVNPEIFNTEPSAAMVAPNEPLVPFGCASDGEAVILCALEHSFEVADPRDSLGIDMPSECESSFVPPPETSAYYRRPLDASLKSASTRSLQVPVLSASMCTAIVDRLRCQQLERYDIMVEFLAQNRVNFEMLSACMEQEVKVLIQALLIALKEGLQVLRLNSRTALSTAIPNAEELMSLTRALSCLASLQGATDPGSTVVSSPICPIDFESTRLLCDLLHDILPSVVALHNCLRVLGAESAVPDLLNGELVRCFLGTMKAVAIAALPSSDLCVCFNEHRSGSCATSLTASLGDRDHAKGFAGLASTPWLMFRRLLEEQQAALNLLVMSDLTRLDSNGLLEFLVVMPRCLSLETKIAYIRRDIQHTGADDYAISSADDRSHVMRVRRSQVLEDTLANLERANLFSTPLNGSNSLKTNAMRVQLLGEDGTGPGVRREWYSLLALEIIKPDAKFFTTSDHGVSFKIAPVYPANEVLSDSCLRRFELLGVVLAIGIIHRLALPVSFTVSLLKQLTGERVCLADLAAEDPILHRSLVWLLENDVTGLDLTFAVDAGQAGAEKRELKAGGAHIAVVQDNKAEYVELLCRDYMTRGTELQAAALRRGFFALMDPRSIAFLSHTELEIMLCGEPDIKVEQWRAHTTLNEFTDTDDTVIWFWRAVESFDMTQRSQLLMFATGAPRLPLAGFANLPGSSGEVLKFQLSNSRDSKHHLPTAHTCFNQLSISGSYDSYEQLRSALLRSISDGANHFGLR